MIQARRYGYGNYIEEVIIMGNLIDNLRIDEIGMVKPFIRLDTSHLSLNDHKTLYETLRCYGLDAHFRVVQRKGLTSGEILVR